MSLLLTQQRRVFTNSSWKLVKKSEESESDTPESKGVIKRIEISL